MAGQQPHCCLFLLYVVLSGVVTVGGGLCSFLWRPLLLRLLELPTECRHPQLPTNHTGLKAMIGTLGKGGTRTMVHVLNDIGLKTYHNEEIFTFSLAAWERRMKELHPESSNYYRANWVRYLLFDVDPRASEELAAAISRCRVEAMSVDGLETLFWPIYDLSPEVKILYLNWRTFKQWRRSLDVYLKTHRLAKFTNFLFFHATLTVPWGLFPKLLDPLYGRPIARTLAEGEPFLQAMGPLWAFYHSQSSPLHKLPQLKYQGPEMTISYLPTLQEDYERVMNYIPERVPPKRYMRVDPRTTKYEELCAFLEVSPCPMKGKLPKAISSFPDQRDFFIQGTVGKAIRGFLHWVNWRLFLGALARCRRCLRRRKEKEG
mmetsp:Transcript_31248/g.99693  ORF Transcript_31248/g.99693 Transcript_31248/m.99693 type:complete len:374 (+) Transcript_31248:109-1230(+)